MFVFPCMETNGEVDHGMARYLYVIIVNAHGKRNGL